MNNMNSILTWARRYKAAGFSVIPLLPKSKKPAVPWEPFQTRLASDEELTKWFSSASANLGIVTGLLSSLAVIDMDGEQGISAGRKLSLYSPVTVLSGNGKHLWFKYAPGLVNSASKIAEGIDIRGEGGFIVAPPSTHENGKPYRFVGVPQLATLPQFPAKVLSVSDAEKKEIKREVKAEDWLDEALEGFKNGHVANTLVSILGKFRAHNFTELSTYELLRPFNRSEEFSDEQLAAKISEIWGRYEPNIIPTSRPTYGAAVELSIRFSGSEVDRRAFESVKKSTEPEVKTGFPSLDRMLEGGIRSERIFTIAARTGENKTNATLAIAKSLCEQNKKVLYFSTEFSFRKIWERYINQLEDPSSFRKHPFYVCDSFSPNLAQVEEAIKEVKPDVFVFDHINHVAEDVRPLGEFMQGCNFLMRKYGCQGVVIAQLNRSADWVENGQRIEPRLSMLKGSGTLEQASSRVLLLSEMRISDAFDEIRAVLAKNDSGTKGLFMLALYKNPYRIKELQ